MASVGNYKIGHKHDQWTEDVYTKGIYLNSKKEGEWITIDEKERLIKITHYRQDQLHGRSVSFDTLDEISYILEYEMGELTTTSSEAPQSHTIARFPTS